MSEGHPVKNAALEPVNPAPRLLGSTLYQIGSARANMAFSDLSAP
jgi:hypothetical protein